MKLNAFFGDKNWLQICLTTSEMTKRDQNLALPDTYLQNVENVVEVCKF